MASNIAKRTTSRARKFPINRTAHVVGAAHTLAGVKLAQKLKAGAVDIVEIRVDAFLDHLDQVERALPSIPFPLLVTVRHPAEGGIGNLTLSRRKQLIARFLPYASLVDVELRSVEPLAEELEQIRKAGATLVVSDHHFRRAPSLPEMVERERRAFRAGADVFKLACLAKGVKEFARLAEFTSRPVKRARAVMGMGRFGQVSRLALAQAGSILNYGYLDQPNAPGQWEARELKVLLGKIGA